MKKVWATVEFQVFFGKQSFFGKPSADNEAGNQVLTLWRIL